MAPPIVETDPTEEAGDAQTLHRPVALNADDLAELEFSLSAIASSIHFALSRPVARHQRERVEDEVAAGNREAEVGRAAVDDRLAVLPDDLRLAVDTALRRRNTRDLTRPSASSDSSSSGFEVPCPSEMSKADLPLITAVEPARDSVKIESNALSIESVRTYSR